MRIEVLQSYLSGTSFNRQVAVIIGGGASVKETDLSPLKNHYPVIGVNDAFKLGDFVDFTWFGDQRWYEWNKKVLEESGMTSDRLFTCAMSLEDDPGLYCFKRGKPVGIENKLGQVAWNRNSGGSAINFAYHLGAKKIILIGFDMKRGVGGRTNWHDNHKARNTNPEGMYRRYNDAFKYIKSDADKLGLVIINTSLDSAIIELDKMTLEEALYE